MNGIQIRGATQCHARGKRQTLALQPVDIDIAPREFSAILGPSGCGKSTLMRRAVGRHAVSTGSITVEGRADNGPGTEVGIVFQSPVLLDWRNTLDAWTRAHMRLDLEELWLAIRNTLAFITSSVDEAVLRRAEPLAAPARGVA